MKKVNKAVWIILLILNMAILPIFGCGDDNHDEPAVIPPATGGEPQLGALLAILGAFVGELIHEWSQQGDECTDRDGDGYGDPASPLCLHSSFDCDDWNASVHPGASENCENGIDDDCDAHIDHDDSECEGSSSICEFDCLKRYWPEVYDCNEALRDCLITYGEEHEYRCYDERDDCGIAINNKYYPCLEACPCWPSYDACLDTCHDADCYRQCRAYYGACLGVDYEEIHTCSRECAEGYDCFDCLDYCDDHWPDCVNCYCDCLNEQDACTIGCVP